MSGMPYRIPEAMWVGVPVFFDRSTEAVYVWADANATDPRRAREAKRTIFVYDTIRYGEGCWAMSIHYSRNLLIFIFQTQYNLTGYLAASLQSSVKCKEFSINPVARIFSTLRTPSLHSLSISIEPLQPSSRLPRCSCITRGVTRLISRIVAQTLVLQAIDQHST